MDAQQPFRIEHDSFGEISIPTKTLYGAQTARAILNFSISGLLMPKSFLQNLARIKKIAAHVNRDLHLLPPGMAEAIYLAAEKIQQGEYLDQFPVDVFQTGSATSTNMNMNEVVAALASTSLPERVHPNDHVNLGQSSNDVIPTAIHLNCVLQCNKSLIPNLRYLAEALEQKALTLKGVVKTGRTHLMDAMPLPMTEEVRAWAHQIHQCVERIESVMSRLYQIAQGGTAVGTGVNTHPEFAQRFAKLLAEDTGMPFVTSPSTYASLSCCDTVVELSGQLKVLAVSLLKICNDLRWMNSGPVCGLGEITLEALQPGSSIMPGKVNPVIPEAVAMVAAQVIGNDATITLAGQSGLFQLNVMLPIVAYNIDQSLNLLGNAVRVLADRAIRTFRVNDEHLRQKLMMNPILATVLTTKIGYEKTAELVKQAYREHRSIREMAKEKTELSDVELDELLSLDHLLGPSTLRRGIMPP